ATVLAVLVTSLFGWSTLSGVVLGLAIGVASTVVLIRVLSDNDALHTRAGHVAVGWLLVEDLFTVLVLVLPGFARAVPMMMPRLLRSPRRSFSVNTRKCESGRSGCSSGS